jgi:hypothetical protein
MARRNIKFAESLQTISKMLTSQIETTVNKSRVIVHPITTGQDINLKTAYMTIDQYEKSIAKLAYECADFIDMPQRPTFQEFIDTFSSIDKQKILFAIYDVTYKATFGTQTVYCPCGKNVFKDEIKLGEVFQPDSFQYFDKTKKNKNEDGTEVDVEVNFKDYELPIKIELDREKIKPAVDMVFVTYIPPISKTIKIFEMLDKTEIIDRVNTIGNPLTKTDELALITKRIELHIHAKDKETGEEKLLIQEEVEPEGIFDTIKNFVNEGDVNIVQTAYYDHFKKYSSNLRKMYTCGHKDKEGKTCNREFDFPVDIEVIMHTDFFRKNGRLPD